LIVGLAGCVLSWWWAGDSYSAALLTDRLLMAEGALRHRPLPDSLLPPDGLWVSTTSQHLAHWAIFQSGALGEQNQSAQVVTSLVGKALEVSPLNPTARLAQAQIEQRAAGARLSIRSLGLSRDAVAMAWTARRLLDAGKRESALKLYGQALALAARGESPRTVKPQFNDDPTVHRYLLPGERELRDIISELALRDGWTFHEWSPALPPHPTVLLATARLLHELGRSEAQTLINRILDQEWPHSTDDQEDPLVLAARAEAFALRSRWKDAEQEYRRAIELIDHETIRRSWWFNLADIAFRLNDEGQRQKALRAALAVTNSDDITRRATEIQRGAGARPRPRLGDAKSNQPN
jgi:tetratricopeptide (TPR) repeat protein